jgi:hypothetical protein
VPEKVNSTYGRVAEISGSERMNNETVPVNDPGPNGLNLT